MLFFVFQVRIHLNRFDILLLGLKPQSARIGFPGAGFEFLVQGAEYLAAVTISFTTR